MVEVAKNVDEPSEWHFGNIAFDEHGDVDSVTECGNPRNVNLMNERWLHSWKVDETRIIGRICVRLMSKVNPLKKLTSEESNAVPMNETSMKKTKNDLCLSSVVAKTIEHLKCSKHPIWRIDFEVWATLGLKVPDEQDPETGETVCATHTWRDFRKPVRLLVEIRDRSKEHLDEEGRPMPCDEDEGEEEDWLDEEGRPIPCDEIWFRVENEEFLSLENWLRNGMSDVLLNSWHEQETRRLCTNSFFLSESKLRRSFATHMQHSWLVGFDMVTREPDTVLLIAKERLA